MIARVGGLAMGMDKQKIAALFGAIEKKDLKAVAALIAGEKKLDVLKDDKAWVVTPLGHAARVGSLKLVEVLLAAGADPNAPGRGTLPLFEAMLKPSAERLKIVARLLESGANPKAELAIASRKRDCLGHFFDFSQKENAPAFRLVLEAGAKADGGEMDKSFGRRTYLFEAVMRGWHETATLLVEHGAKPDSGKPDTFPTLNPLRRAVQDRDARMVEILFRTKPAPSTKFLEPSELASLKSFQKTGKLR